MNSHASLRLVLLALALVAGAYLGLNHVAINPARLFQILGGLATVVGLIAVVRRDYAPRRPYGCPVSASHAPATRRRLTRAATTRPTFAWDGDTVSA